MYSTDIANGDLNLQLTAAIGSIPITTDNFTDDYWLGWVAYANVPMLYHVSAFTWDTDNDTTLLTDVTLPENVPIGYVSCYSAAVDNAIYDQGIVLTKIGANWGHITYTPGATQYSSDYFRLPNKLDVNTSQLGDELWVGILYALNGVYAGVVWVNVTITGMIADSDFTITMGTYTTTHKLSDFNNYAFTTETDTTTDNVYTFCIYAWRCSVNDPSVKTDGTGSVLYQRIHPFMRLHESYTGDGLPYIAGFRADANMGNYNTLAQYDGYIRGLTTGNIFESNVFNWIFGGYVGSFSISEWATYQQTGGIYKPDTAVTFFLVDDTSNANYGSIHRIYTRDEIYKACAIQHRFTTVSTNVYANTGQIYAGVDLETNEFLTTFVDGADTDQLTAWQLIDGTTDGQYIDPDTIPIYVPPDTDDDSIGDDITGYDFTNTPLSAGNNFVTMYGLNTAQVEEFGRKMWAKLGDTAYWQMVGTAFTNDFSINPADMMRYFTFLRYYPFDVSIASGALSGIFIGRASTAITLDTLPFKITKNVVQLDGGTLTIQPHYRDFRDYEPLCDITVTVPFCGSVSVAPSEVIGKTLSLSYVVDLQTGAMLAILYVQSDTLYILATLAGTCGATIPITANNNMEFLQRIATVAQGTLTGGISGAVKGAAVGGEVGAVVGAIGGTAAGGVGALAGLPPVVVHKQGNASGFANLGGDHTAYATIQWQKYAIPDNYGHSVGYACDFTDTIGNLSGFTVCRNVDTSGLSCNADERDEIKRLLESGVYV